jgi:hypothetical protein
MKAITAFALVLTLISGQATACGYSDCYGDPDPLPYSGGGGGRGGGGGGSRDTYGASIARDQFYKDITTPPRADVNCYGYVACNNAVNGGNSNSIYNRQNANAQYNANQK